MDKKKVIVIALILFLGLGTFVFANPSEAYNEETGIKEDGYGSDDTGDQYTTEDDSNYDSFHSSDEITEETGQVDDTRVAIQTFVRDYVNMNHAVDFITGDNAAPPNFNQGGNTSGGGNNSGNNDGNTGGQGNGEKPVVPTEPSNPSEGDTNQPTEPTDPVDPVPPVEPDDSNEEQKEQYDQIKKLVATLEIKVKNAKNKEDIAQAKIYRDSNTIEAQVQKITDAALKQELLAILNSVNLILNDEAKPVIEGAIHKGYYKENVVLTIKEQNIKEIKVNGKVVSNQTTLTFTEEGKYEVVVLDAAFNKTSVTFTIDKTAPVAIVSTSNDGEKTNEDVTVYIKVNEVVKPVDGWVLSSDKKELSKVFKENTTSSLTIEDLAGNQTVVSYEVFDINRDLPMVEEDQIHYSITTLTNGDVVVTITTNKDIFTPDGWEMVSGSRVFTKTYKANTVEKVALKDGYKNVGYVTIEITNIDKTPPEAVFVIDSQKTNQSIIGKIVANEPIKEVKGWISSTDKKELIRSFDENVKDSVVIEDLAGNQTVVKYVVQNIDKEVSDIKVTTSNDGKPTNQDVIVTISSSEEIEKVEGWILSEDKKSISRVFSSNIKASVMIQDKAGNQELVEYEVFDIDKTPPEITEIEYSLTSDNKIKATIKTEKAVFTPKGWEMVSNSMVFTKIYEESTTETIRLKDSYHNRLNFVITVDVDAIRKALLTGNKQILSGDQMMEAVTPVFSSIFDVAKSIIL